MILKEFAYETTPGAAHTRRVMETRFLINGASTDAWKGFSFRWRPDGSDADLLTDTDTVAWPLDNGARHAHVYPSRTQCTRCHHPSNGPLLGLRTAQLARRFDYDGIIADQLETLASLGAIPAPPGQSRAAPFTSPHDTSAPLELRVRGYLAANCSHCHNPTGERPTRDFRWETPLERTLLCGPDAEVVAGDPASSVLVQRISARPGMPPLATLATDPLVIDIATRWIAGETNCQ
jgi:cytochrome c553